MEDPKGVAELVSFDGFYETESKIWSKHLSMILFIIFWERRIVLCTHNFQNGTLSIWKSIYTINLR